MTEMTEIKSIIIKTIAGAIASGIIGHSTGLFNYLKKAPHRIIFKRNLKIKEKADLEKALEKYEPLELYAKDDRTQEIKPLLECWGRRTRVVITGEGGAGKTRALHTIWKELYESKKTLSYFIRLSSLPDEKSIVSSMVAGDDKAVAELKKTTGKFPQYMLLLDGLDEVYGEKKTRIRNELAELAGYQNLGIVITSREKSTEQRFDHIELQPLICETVEKYLEASNKSPGNVPLELLQNLMMLTLYCETENPGHNAWIMNMPSDKPGQLINNYLEGIIWSRYRNNYSVELAKELWAMRYLMPFVANHMERNKTHHISVTKDLLKPICDEGLNSVFIDNWFAARKLYAEWQTVIPDKERFLSESLDYLLNNQLGKVTDGIFEFDHSYYRDFFSARYIIYICGKAGKSSSLPKELDYHISGNTVRFVADIIPYYKNDDILKTLLDNIRTAENDYNMILSNIIRIWFCWKGNIDSIDFSDIDLRAQNLYPFIKGQPHIIFDNANVTYKNFFPSGHTKSLNNVQISKNCDLVITASADGTAIIWDINTGDIKQTLGTRDNKKSINMARLSPDANYAVTASSDWTAAIWDLNRNEIKHTISHESFVNSAEFSHNGKYVVTASADGSAIICDMQGNTKKLEPIHEKPVNTAKFSPSDEYIVTASADKKARIWRVSNRERVGKDLEHDDVVRLVEFNPDIKSNTILTVSNDSYVRIWDWQANSNVSVRIDGARHAAFSPDGSMVVITSDKGNASIWKFPYETNPLVELKGGKASIKRADFVRYRNKWQVVAACDDKTVRIWDENGLEIGPRFEGLNGMVKKIKSSADGRYVVAASIDSSAILWSIADHNREPRRLSGQNHCINSIQFSNNNKLVVTASKDGTACVWDIEEKNRRRTLAHNGEVTMAGFSWDDNRIATSCVNGEVRIWDIEDQNANPTVIQVSNDNKSVNSVMFSRDNNRILTASEDKSACVWTVMDGESIYCFNHEASVNCAQFSRDEKYVVTGSADNLVRVWDFEQEDPIRIFSGHERSVKTVQFSPNGRFIVSASEDDRVRIWDMESTSDPLVMESAFFHIVHCKNIADDVGADKIAVTASSPDKIQLWSLEGAGDSHSKVIYHQGAVTEPCDLAQYSPYNLLVAAVAPDVQTNNKTDRHLHLIRDEGIYDVSFSPDGKYIAAAYSNGRAKIFDISGDVIKKFAILDHRYNIELANCDLRNAIFDDSLSDEDKVLLTAYGAMDRGGFLEV